MTRESSVLRPVLPQELEPAVAYLHNAVVGKLRSPTPLDAAEELIEKLKPGVDIMYPEASDPDAYAQVSGEVLARLVIVVGPADFLKGDGFRPWFDAAVSEGRIRLDRWYSYKQFLSFEKKYPPQVLDALDKSSGEVVDLVGDPSQTGAWKRRGLVIGDVQSGKTATYIGIVNKAADAGFKLVVLLTGGTESLRQQTQYRIDEGFLGRDSSVNNSLVKDSSITAQVKLLGVGLYPTKSTFLRGQGMTTHATDFNTASLAALGVYIDPHADHPYIFVMKKNKTPLTNLIAWLKSQFHGKQFDIPMLVVDDEADYASVNTNYKTNGEKNPTLINQKIRELLALATRSSYLAFTATPFANVFIDHTTDDDTLHDDLFPHHYIYALSSPSNYVGATKFFPTSDTEPVGDGDDIDNSDEATSEHLVDVTDAHDVFPPKHKSQLSVSALPSSLEEAIRAFVVASAIRVARGDGTPRSMLVNVSRFMRVQQQVYDLVANEFANVKTAVEIHANPPRNGPDSHPVLISLAETFDTYFADSGVEWPTVRDHLFQAVLGVTVELVNSSRNKSTDDKPRSLIAVGGDVLSRGLTLDGLTISYFYRVVGAADTLLQMARWFGYRPGYEDLVRVWISPDAAGQFRYVATISDELREQIREMRHLRKTPADFGLMIRKHPESLAITAKKGAAQIKSMVISLSGRLIETPRIPAVNATLKANERAVRDFLAAIEGDARWETAGTFPLKRGIPRGRIADLLARFSYDRGNLILGNSLHDLIRRNTSSAFQDWTVGVVGGTGDPVKLAPDLGERSVPMRAVRYAATGTPGTFLVSGSKQRVAGPTDLAKTYAHDGESDLREPAVYGKLPHPVLLIYAIEPRLQIDPKGDSEHAKQLADAETEAARTAWDRASSGGVSCLMALKIAIPGEPGSTRGDVEYMINSPLIDEFKKEFEVSDEDEGDLDE